VANVRPQDDATYTAEDDLGRENHFARNCGAGQGRRCLAVMMSNTVTLFVSRGTIDMGKRRSGGPVQRIRGDAFVCRGLLSPCLQAPLGIRLPIYPAKGYRPMTVGGTRRRLPGVADDDEFKSFLDYTSKRDRMRIAGPAESNGTTATGTECDASSCDGSNNCFGLPLTPSNSVWTGLRPATPSNVPLIGARRKLRICS